MNEVRFDPQSWDDGARRVTAGAQDFAATANATLARVSDLGRLGCNYGGTLADAALAMVFPALFQAVQETVAGISDGLSQEAANMQVTATNYRTVEESNTATAATLDAGA